jgi:hypothetical protein
MYRRSVVVKTYQRDIAWDGQTILLGCSQYAVSHLITGGENSGRTLFNRKFKKFACTGAAGGWQEITPFLAKFVILLRSILLCYILYMP